VYELAALLIGAGLGVVLHRLGPRVGVPIVGLGALSAGLLVSSLSGELELSWAFLLFDIGQVLVAAICVAALARVVSSQSSAP
jgi:hypothetical protein